MNYKSDQEIVELYKKAYLLLDRHPLAQLDCGQLCGKKCCCYMHPEDEEGGMELLPGEEKIFPLESSWFVSRLLSGDDYDYPPVWGPGSGCIQIRCIQPCLREERPLNCRLFPFFVYREETEYYLAMGKGEHDYTCRLTEENERINGNFIEAARETARLLLSIDKFKQLVDWDSAGIMPQDIRKKILIFDKEKK